ncbi:MAG: dihydrofolate reductase family protein [Thermoleophilia bacterium]|nr:dihydrofolate reductase family protein [Thermoleophilia bacterium]
MARLVYSAITSLDGYVNDREGSFDWCMPDEQVHAAVNDLTRTIDTYLLGRGMYDVLAVWDTIPTDDPDEPEMSDYARLWQAADKVVYSTTLDAVDAPRTRPERSFEVEAVRALVAAADRDVSIGGPTLAAHALRAGLVDELHLFQSPVIIGGGTRALPDDVWLELELVDQRRFDNGVVHVHYRVVK